MDRRRLVFKRWNASCTQSILNETLGNYITFQSYHFIEIKKYDESEQKENKQSSGISNDKVHIVQSMMIEGEDCGFWKTPADILYISLIQLDDPFGFDIDKIKNEIQGVISNIFNSVNGQDQKPQWALYYSFDYCDLVLFVKNISVHKMGGLLWAMSQERKGAFQSIRDTYTIHCFGQSFIKNAFSQIESKEQPSWQEDVTMRISLNVKNFAIIKELEDQLKTHKIESSFMRETGHYDYSACFNSISGSDAMKIMYELNKLSDSQTQDSNAKPFGEYKISFMSQLPKTDSCVTPEKEYVYTNQLIKMLENCEKKCINCEQLNNNFQIEILRSLYELAENGFASEFVLSIIPSLNAFIDMISQTKNWPQNDPNIDESIERIKRRYYSALNTLSLCTMHSERRFEHVPAFNANYFEIPPKMLLYYNAVVYRAAKLIAQKDPSYGYLIIPDYREDIYVKPLFVKYAEDTDKHLAIIYLPERYFYQPEQALLLLAHEIGHYEGDRKRSIRANHILRLMCIKILSYTYLINPLIDANVTEIKEGTLVYELADEAAKYIRKHLERRNRTRGIKFHLRDVTAFIEERDYLLYFFMDEGLRQDIICIWKEIIIKKVQKEVHDRNRHDEVVLLGFIKQLDSIENTRYYSKLLKIRAAEELGEIMANCIVDRCWKLLHHHEEAAQGLGSFREFITCLFSESFADQQIKRIYKDFDNKVFSKMLTKREESPREDTEMRIRLMSPKTNMCKIVSINKSISILENTVYRHVQKYLEQCEISQIDDNEILTAKMNKSESIYKQITPMILEFQNQLFQMFNSEN